MTARLAANTYWGVLVHFSARRKNKKNHVDSNLVNAGRPHRVKRDGTSRNHFCAPNLALTCPLIVEKIVFEHRTTTICGGGPTKFTRGPRQIRSNSVLNKAAVVSIDSSPIHIVDPNIRTRVTAPSNRTGELLLPHPVRYITTTITIHRLQSISVYVLDVVSRCKDNKRRL